MDMFPNILLVQKSTLTVLQSKDVELKKLLNTPKMEILRESPSKESIITHHYVTNLQTLLII
jgi:hypothetical protein